MDQPFSDQSDHQIVHYQDYIGESHYTTLSINIPTIHDYVDDSDEGIDDCD